MNELFLVLYTRIGCCLCEGLEQKLRNLNLSDIHSKLKLQIIDIDNDDLSDDLRNSYDLEVPVICFRTISPSSIFRLPRASPRLNEEELHKWLKKIIDNQLQLIT